LAHYFALRVRLAGELEPRTSYLLNIKDVDREVRAVGIGIVAAAIREGRFGAGMVAELFERLRGSWSGVRLDQLELALSPLMVLQVCAKEFPMVRLSQKFEFSATHRLYNPKLSEEENRRAFGKCNNPHGHGHNYELAVTLAGQADQALLANVPEFERVVATTVIDRFDHKNLNVEVEEFRELIPTVENIAKVIYGMLKPRFAEQKARLASVTVWETPKTWCEYSE
jgi:6-pyruvoyltetrahydropterin/6-carboxytetrahydropterin synthase